MALGLAEDDPPAGVAQLPSPRQNLLEEADVPLFKLVTGRFPVTPPAPPRGQVDGRQEGGADGRRAPDARFDRAGAVHRELVHRANLLLQKELRTGANGCFAAVTENIRRPRGPALEISRRDLDAKIHAGALRAGRVEGVEPEPGRDNIDVQRRRPIGPQEVGRRAIDCRQADRGGRVGPRAAAARGGQGGARESQVGAQGDVGKTPALLPARSCELFAVVAAA